MGKGKEQQPNEPAQEEDPNDPKNMKPACACCCGPSSDAADLTPEHLQDTENFFGNRSCTDCCMVVLYAIFLIGWIIVIALAVQFGKPDRIIKPDNYRGDICGDGRLEAYPNYFVPLPSRSTYGICVAKCPEVGDVVCNNDIEPKVEDTSVSVANHYYDQTKAQFGQGLKDYATCKASNCDSTTQASADRYIATQLKLKQKKCFVVFYPSAPSLFRCIPGKGPSAGSENITLQSLANETAQTLKDLANTFGVGSFFTLGFSEIEQTWRVILICSFTCMGVALVWVLLLRWILAPIVYFVIVLILGVLIGLGFVFKWFVEDLEEGALPGEEGVENQIKLWKAAEWASFLLAAIYFGVMLHMLQRIRIAIAVMKEASKAFTSAPSMVLIPCITFIMLIGWIAWFIVTTIYIQTMGSEAAEAFNQAATDLLGENLNISALIASNNNSAISSAAGSASSIPVINISNWATLPQTKVLHLYNFFGVLWTGNICLMFGFMTMAMTVCSWYFSATQIQLRALESEDAAEKETGKDKQTVPFAVARAAWCTFWKHLGTVIWGALLIAIIQFIRAIFTYIAENYLKEAKDNWAAKVLIRIAECCLWYIEQVVKLISKNAYIITAIRNTSFCVSAFTALKLLLCNAARFVILSMLSAATIFLIKLFIVGINIFIAFGLLKENSLTNDKHVESGLFPIFLITIMSFVIASLFLNVYEACIDTIFLCFLVDEEEFKGKFMPQSLESIVKVFEGADIARREYEKNVRQAMIKAEQSAEAGSK